jgi:hypothetical protein
MDVVLLPTTDEDEFLAVPREGPGYAGARGYPASGPFLVLASRVKWNEAP